MFKQLILDMFTAQLFYSVPTNQWPRARLCKNNRASILGITTLSLVPKLSISNDVKPSKVALGLSSVSFC